MTSPATVVHHLKSSGRHPDLRLDLENLEALCSACHNRITAEEQRNGDADGWSKTAQGMRFYRSKPWLALRAVVLRRNPWCCRCKEEA